MGFVGNAGETPSKESLDDNMIEWLKNSIEIQDKEDFSIIIKILPSYLLENDETNDELKENRNKLIKSRIEKLENFNRFNSDLITILNSRLED